MTSDNAPAARAELAALLTESAQSISAILDAEYPTPVSRPRAPGGRCPCTSPPSTCAPAQPAELGIAEPSAVTGSTSTASHRP
ncbi:hypothetical protein GCM10009665_80050 [Kitasatospora nipponensis]|uniref:Uncharacterized protein n=1 Tax=Kitasatospora nipponensis TaxID=258049 RepID=A0ABP4DYW2_9ACTN